MSGEVTRVDPPPGMLVVVGKGVLVLSGMIGEGVKPGLPGTTTFGGREKEGDGDGGPLSEGQLERRGSASTLGRMLDTDAKVKRKRLKWRISGNPT